MFGELSDGIRNGAGQQAQRFLQATRTEFVDVGVPRSDQRQTQAMREQHPENADVAGAGDMNQLRAELLQISRDGVEMAQEEKIERHVALQPDAAAAAGEFE